MGIYRIISVLILAVRLFSCNELVESCVISNVDLTVGECLTDNTYKLTLNFEHENVTDDYFDILDREGNPIGFYSFSDLPVVIEDFKLSGRDYDYLKICVNDNPECCEEVEFLALDCSHKDCQIRELIVDVGDCTGENTYNLHLNFAYENPGNEYFEVFVRENQRIGTYKLSDLPLKIENFERSGKDWDFIKVCINDHPDCCKAAEFQPPKCDS